MHLMQLEFEFICDEVVPDWKYTYPAEWTVVNVGCGDGIGRQRTAVESCPARGGCNCTHKRPNLPIETEMQPSCSASANMTLSGQPADCENGALNGEWTYQGDTADGKKYYMRDTKWERYGVVYLFFDKDGDAGTRQTLMPHPLRILL